MEVNEIIKKSFLVIHTEAFKESSIRKIEFSISTKVADLLASGTCILAYGPDDVASIKHLKENNAAYLIDKKEKLAEMMKEIILNPALTKEILENAAKTAQKYHNPELVTSVIYNEIFSATKERENNENSIY